MGRPHAAAASAGLASAGRRRRRPGPPMVGRQGVQQGVLGACAAAALRAGAGGYPGCAYQAGAAEAQQLRHVGADLARGGGHGVGGAAAAGAGQPAPQAARERRGGCGCPGCWAGRGLQGGAGRGCFIRGSPLLVREDELCAEA
jgi:hypothetical protein